MRLALLEEETRRQWELNRELESLLNFLLSTLEPDQNEARGQPQQTPDRGLRPQELEHSG